tara:strand:+ start:347 stop:607 length:261 start_codon:yes stop_codon:yes gene_type:complete
VVLKLGARHHLAARSRGGLLPSFFYAIIINKNKAMDKGKLKVLLFDLKNILNELESEVYSDVKSYVASAPISDYEEVFEDDDGYAD